MARTNYVKKFRGQRKCQFTPEPTEEVRWPPKCGEPKSAHLYWPGGVGDEKEWTISDHVFTQTPLTCGFCGKPIEIGMGYKWVAPRPHRATKGAKKSRHTDCPEWKPSELTSSPTLSAIYAAQEGAEEQLGQVKPPEEVEGATDVIGELEGIAEGVADELEGVAEQLEESATNMEEGFGHATYQSDELRQKGEDIQQWTEELRDVSLSEPEVEEETSEDDLADLLDDWTNEQVEVVTEAVGNSPL